MVSEEKTAFMSGEGAFLFDDPFTVNGLDLAVVKDKAGVLPVFIFGDKPFHLVADFMGIFGNGRLVAFAHPEAYREARTKSSDDGSNNFKWDKHRKLYHTKEERSNV